LTPICTKSFVGWSFAPDPTGGAYSAPPNSIAVFRGPTSKGMERERNKKDRKRGENEGEKRYREGREGVRPLP